MAAAMILFPPRPCDMLIIVKNLHLTSIILVPLRYQWSGGVDDL